MECGLTECLPVCISGLVALIWTAYQEFKLYKIKKCQNTTTQA